MNTLIVENKSSLKVVCAPKKRDPWVETAVSGGVMEVIKEESYVRDALRLIRGKCGLGGARHAFGVAENMLLAVNEMGLPRKEKKYSIIVGLLHDIGKTEMVDDFSENADELTDEQREIMKEHPRKSFEILKAYGKMEVAKIVVGHHELTKGYPRNLAKRVEDIRLDGSSMCYSDSGYENELFRRLRDVLSISDIFQSMECQCYDGRPYIICRNSKDVIRAKARELSVFLSKEQRCIIELLKKRSFKLSVSKKRVDPILRIKKACSYLTLVAPRSKNVN